MKLSIIIVSYNVKYFLEQCLCSVKAAIQNIAAEVWVVDNCSADGTIAYLKERFSWVHILENSINEGFAKANNKVLAKCTGEYVLFLNPDTLLAENTLAGCIAFLDKNAKAGAVGVQMLDGTGRFLPESKRAYPSPLVSFYKTAGFATAFPSSAHFNKYALGNLDKNGVHKVGILSGAFLMGRRNLLQKIGGFDEAFFMYGEDIDLSYRIMKEGFHNYYIGTLSIVHFKGESAADRKKHNKVFYHAMHVFVKKHYTGMNRFALKFLLRSGVFAKNTLALFKEPLHKVVNKTSKVKRSIYLVGEPAATATAEKILLKHKLQKSFKGSVMIEKTEHYQPVTGAEVIFCAGNLTYAATIETIQEQATKNRYMWHGPFTNSIVGSPDKKGTGIIYHSGYEEDHVERQ